MKRVKAISERKCMSASGRGGYQSVLREIGKMEAPQERLLLRPWESVIRLEPETFEETNIPEVEDIPEKKYSEMMGKVNEPFLEHSCVPTIWWMYLRRPWSWRWRWVLGFGVGACILLRVLMCVEPETNILYTTAMALCVPLAMVVFFCEVDVSRRVHAGVATLVTLLGGGAAVVLATIANDAWGITWDTAYLAGFTEEPIKAVMLLCLLPFSKHFPCILSGLTLGVCIGAGFAVLETIEYAYLFGEDEFPSTVILLLRGGLSPFMHMAWTGALGGALWMARRHPIHWLTAIGVFLGMMVLHCLWNAIGPIEYLALATWGLIFYYIKRGATEAATLNFAHEDTCS